MKYIENLSQEKNILAFLRERGSQGVYVYELTTSRRFGGLGISQYNARINGLRAKGYQIENVVPGHFVLLSSPKDKKPLETQSASEFTYIEKMIDGRTFMQKVPREAKQEALGL